MSKKGNPLPERKEPAPQVLEPPKRDTIGESYAASDLGKPVEEKGKKFRFSRQFGHFVYKHHVDKTFMLDFFTEIAGHELEEFYIAHENSDPQNPYEHTHVLVNFGGVIDRRNCAFADIEIPGDTAGETIKVHPWIGGPRDWNHWATLVRYLGKEDPENEELKNYELAENSAVQLSSAEVVWQCKTYQDALIKFADDLGALTVKTLWDAKAPTKLKESKLIPVTWQASCLDRLEKPGNSRFVTWYVDETGACGKSSLIKEALTRWPKDATYIKMGGIQARDISRLLKNNHDRGNSLRVILFDVPRTMQESDTALYTMLESCADGMLSSAKYDSDNLTFEPEHICVFANFWPTLSLLSADRWVIHKLVWNDPAAPPAAWKRYADACTSGETPEDTEANTSVHMPNIIDTVITAGIEACAYEPDDVSAFMTSVMNAKEESNIEKQW